ncbi:MAG: 8-amino-7-oxononanoate synthase [Proteobacteria bacterium]|nr:8-amino-7-oxononanoate synthase [Pseudomonadota bacterium]MBU4297912.1 8-amino-7-oxononanoate synthase [Pseudomonadota bacterium]MCG2746032.1 8-amino-7-oxononanoate synthase [Desulfobulbaceae bacterium]
MDIRNWLTEQKKKDLLRQLTPVKRLPQGQLVVPGHAGRRLLDFSSNDYLGLSCHPELMAQSRHFLDMAGCGAGAARLMSGDLAMYHQLETEVAELKGQEAALLFGSGYLANCGVIPALVGRNDVIFTDRLNHASIYDGCSLSRAKLVRFHHNDLNHLEELLHKQRGKGEALIVVESLYSMDGDRCPLRDLVQLKERFNCLLMVDEAHATGVFGKNGGGIIEEEGVAGRVDLAMGTFGKALGSYGAYIASTKNMIDFLINRARTFIFSTGLPPAVIGASLGATRIIRREPELRRDLFAKVDCFKAALAEIGLTSLGPSQIVPIMIGDSSRALHIAQSLRGQGIFATAVRPPTVPEGTARLRFSITRHLEREALQKAASLIGAALQAS